MFECKKNGRWAKERIRWKIKGEAMTKEFSHRPKNALPHSSSQKSPTIEVNLSQSENKLKRLVQASTPDYITITEDSHMS